MGLFKKRAKTEEPSTEWEETLVAKEEGTPEPDIDAATLTDQPVPVVPEPESAWASRPAGEWDPEVQSHLRTVEGKTILVEKQFDRPTKRFYESEVTSSPRVSLQERTWMPAHEIDHKAIRRDVDKISVYKPRPAGRWLSTQFKKAPKASARSVVPQNILAKKVVYETEGGFVVEVTYRSGTETRKAFFTVDSSGGREKALASLVSGRAALSHSILGEAIDSLRKPTKVGALPVPPGKVSTYPITNDTDVMEIEGVGDTYARRLHELGIHTTDQLRLMNATVIANNIGTSPATVQTWQAMCELLGVPGIGKQYAEVLARAGVSGIDALKKQKPKALARTINELIKNSKPRILGSGVRTPRVQGWVKAARRLKKQTQPFPVLQR